MANGKTATLTRPRMEQRQATTPAGSIPEQQPPVPQSEIGREEARLQTLAWQTQRGETVEEDLITVRLCIAASDVDAVRYYDERLPISLVRAILSPSVADFFIPIVGSGRMKPPRAKGKGHFLHTSFIHEVILLDELPEERT